MRFWIFLMVVSMTAPVSHAAPPSSNVLTLDQALVRVLEQSPRLKADEYTARAAAERIKQAKQSRPFNLKLELQNFSGSGVYSGSDTLESTLSFAKVLELGDKADLRGDVAQNRVLLLKSEQDADRLDLLAETTRRFIHVATDQQRLTIANESLSLARQTLNTVKRRVRAGRAPDAELRRAEITIARKQLQLEHAEHELATSRLKLATLWGETQVTFGKAEADLFGITPVATFAQLTRLLGRNPELVRFATEKRLAQTRLQLAQARRRSDLEISAGVRHFNASDDTALIMSFSLPLGTTSRAKPFVTEAEMLRQRDPLIQEQRRLVLHATLFEVHQEIQHAIDAVTTLRNTIIPNAKAALREYEKGYAAGRYSFLELSEAQNTLLSSKLEAVMAAANYHRYRTEIDRLTGAQGTQERQLP